MYVPLCEPWDLPDDCTLDESPGVEGTALRAASEVLWELSGHQFGQCSVVLRPCRAACGPPSPGPWWPVTGLPWPVTPYGGWWPLEAACGACRRGCGCTSASEVDLPAPGVASVDEVTVDGVVLDAGAYALYDAITLTRTDGEAWPLCQDWSVPVSGMGAWTISATVGVPVPAAGRVALAELGREYARACRGQDCRLPKTMTSQVRQGLSQTFPTPAQLRELDMTGLPMVDRFLQAYNPGRLRMGPAIWNPDDYGDPSPRRPGSPWG